MHVLHWYSRLFEDAATQLNLVAVLGFLQELCGASRAQLFLQQPVALPQPHRGRPWSRHSKVTPIGGSNLPQPPRWRPWSRHSNVTPTGGTNLPQPHRGRPWSRHSKVTPMIRKPAPTSQRQAMW